MQLIRPVLSEHWVIGGAAQSSPSPDLECLYIVPLLGELGLVSDDQKVLHSLVLDTNVLSDLVQQRRPDANSYLIQLLRSHPIEVNPVYAMMEQRQRYGGASEVLHSYVNFAKQTFGWEAAQKGRAAFESSLAAAKDGLVENAEALSGYIAAISYLYRQNAGAALKLEWLSGMIRSADLPYLPIQFYYAALAFLSAERPHLFSAREVKKIRKDLAPCQSLEEQRLKAANVANDLMLPSTALFQTAGPEVLVFPYIATRDVAMQLLLSEIWCASVESRSDGRALGAWGLRPGRKLQVHLGECIEANMPTRDGPTSREEIGVRRARLRAFSDTYLQRCVHSTQP